MVRVFADGPGDHSSILGRVISKTQKIVLDASLLNAQHYKVRIKGKVEQSRERSSAPLHLSVVAIGKGAFELNTTTAANFIILLQRCLSNKITNQGCYAIKQRKETNHIYIHIMEALVL